MDRGAPLKTGKKVNQSLKQRIGIGRKKWRLPSRSEKRSARANFQSWDCQHQAQQTMECQLEQIPCKWINETEQSSVLTACFLNFRRMNLDSGHYVNLVLPKDKTWTRRARPTSVPNTLLTASLTLFHVILGAVLWG